MMLAESKSIRSFNEARIPLRISSCMTLAIGRLRAVAKSRTLMVAGIKIFSASPDLTFSLRSKRAF